MSISKISLISVPPHSDYNIADKSAAHRRNEHCTLISLCRSLIPVAQGPEVEPVSQMDITRLLQN